MSSTVQTFNCNQNGVTSVTSICPFGQTIVQYDIREFMSGLYSNEEITFYRKEKKLTIGDVQVSPIIAENAHVMPERLAIRAFREEFGGSNFSQNCHHLDFQFMGNTEWAYLLNFDNKCHYLSLRSTGGRNPLGPQFKIFQSLVEIQMSNLNGLFSKKAMREQILNFMTKHFSLDDVLAYFSYYKQPFLFVERDILKKCISEETSDNPYIYKWNQHPVILNLKECDTFLGSKCVFSILEISSLSESNSHIGYLVELLHQDIDRIKKILIQYQRILEWFRTSEVDIIDLSKTMIKSEVLECLTKCKVIILQEVNSLSDESVKKFIKKNPDITVVYKMKKEENN